MWTAAWHAGYAAITITALLTCDEWTIHARCEH